jgi:hypothetical protein
MLKMIVCLPCSGLFGYLQRNSYGIIRKDARWNGDLDLEL